MCFSVYFTLSRAQYIISHVICTWINVLILSNRFNYLFAHLGPLLLLWKPYSSDRRDLTILRIDFWHFGSKSRTVGRRKLVPNRPNKENFFEAYSPVHARVNPAPFLKVCSLLFSFQPCAIFHCRLATPGKPSLVRSGKTAVVYCRGLVSKAFGCIR